jgi:hypothetical protein
MTAAFTVNPALTGIAIAYRNEELIADMVLPRMPVGTKEFKYNELPIQDAITVTNTLVGRKSAPRQVEFGMIERPGNVNDYGLTDGVPIDDIEQANTMRAQGGVYDPKATAVQNLTDLVALDREVRVASVVFNAATYPVGNRTVLAGTSQWSDPLSNPITAISDALDIPMMRPNVCVMGRVAWTKLRRHPAMVKAANRSNGDSGMITKQEFMDMFELKEFHIGEGFVNIARPGQAPVLSRVWGRNCVFFRRDTLATPKGGRATFGFTAQFSNKVVGERPNGDIGLRGGVEVKSGESVGEIISAPNLAYYFENCVAA